MMNLALKLSALISLIALIGCATPLNRVTSDRYSQTCSEAERVGNMQLAAEACYRAYINVEWGNLGPEVRSEKLYNFGRVLRKAGRYDDAKEALIRSLAEEEGLSGKNSIKSGRRMAELSATYLELNQLESGIPYLDAVLPITNQYTKNEKQFIAALLYFYGKNLHGSNKVKAESYHSKMVKLGYSSLDFE
jgi:hypothetical protein